MKSEELRVDNAHTRLYSVIGGAYPKLFTINFSLNYALRIKNLRLCYENHRHFPKILFLRNISR